MSTDGKGDDKLSWLYGGSLKPPMDEEQVAFIAPGAATVTSSASAVQVTLTSMGVDATPMLDAMYGLGDPQLTALNKHALHPDEVSLPLPRGLPRERHADVAAAFAYSILDGRTHERQEKSKVKDRRAALWGPVLGALAGGGILGYLIKWLSG